MTDIDRSDLPDLAEAIRLTVAANEAGVWEHEDVARINVLRQRRFDAFRTELAALCNRHMIGFMTFSERIELDDDVRNPSFFIPWDKGSVL